jgi:hypothetical protein
MPTERNSVRIVICSSKMPRKPLDEIIHTVTYRVGTWTHDRAVRNDITILLDRKF